MNFRPFKKNKRAEWVDYLYGIVIIFALGICIVVGKIALDKVNTSFQGNDAIDDSVKERLNTANSNYTGLWDGLFVFVIIGIYLGMFISAYFIRSHPIFYIIFVIIIIIFSLLNMLFADIFHSIMSGQGFSEYSNSFTKMGWLMGTQFAIIMLVLSGLLAIFMYGKGDSNAL